MNQSGGRHGTADGCVSRDCGSSLASWNDSTQHGGEKAGRSDTNHNSHKYRISSGNGSDNSSNGSNSGKSINGN